MGVNKEFYNHQIAPRQLDLIDTVLIDSDKIKDRVYQLAEEMFLDYQGSCVDIFVVGKAGLPFFNDLIKSIQDIRAIRKPETDLDDIHLSCKLIPKIEKKPVPEYGEPVPPLNL